MSETAIIEKEIERGITIIQDEATTLMVVDSASFTQAGEILKGIKGLEKQIKTYFEPLKKAAYASWKQICDREGEEIAKLKPGADHLNKQMVAYLTEQERIELEKNRIANAELKRREEEDRINAAIDAEKNGEKEVADALLNEPVFVASIPQAPATPKVSGLSMKGTWKATVINLPALIKAVAEGKAPAMCLQANETFLNAQARAGKGTIQFPGVEMKEDKNMSGVRSR